MTEIKRNSFVKETLENIHRELKILQHLVAKFSKATTAKHRLLQMRSIFY